MMRVMVAALALFVAASGLVAGADVKAAPPKPASPKKTAPAVVDWTRTVVATPEGGVRMGNPAAKVKLIEYGSRTCPHCAHFDHDGLPALKAGYIAAGQVSYEFRDFPIHNVIDLGPILLGHCVSLRAFFPVLDDMMANQLTLIGRSAQIPAAEQAKFQTSAPTVVVAYLAKFYGYTDLVVKRGLPIAAANACLADRARMQSIAKQAEFATKTYALASTPTFIVDGAVQANVADWATLEPVLRSAVAK